VAVQQQAAAVQQQAAAVQQQAAAVQQQAAAVQPQAVAVHQGQPARPRAWRTTTSTRMPTPTRSLLASLAIVATLALGACANLPPPPEPRRPAQVADRHFEVGGRFALRFRDEAGSGRIAWTHRPQSDDLAILSPIGQGIARIVRKDGLYTLTTADQREHSSPDPDALTEAVLGWRLPLSGLPFWLRGHEAPGSQAEKVRAGDDRVSELRQAGWTIEYLSRHAPSGLPERLRIRRDDLDLRLVLEEWHTPP